VLNLRKHATRAAFIAVAAVYIALAFIYIPTGVYWSADLGMRWHQASSPYDDFTIPYPGQHLDPELKFVPFDPALYSIKDGRIYSTQPRVLPLLIKPLVLLWGMRGALMVPLLAGLVSVALAGVLTRHSTAPAWLGILLAGLGTPLIFYSIVIWEHTLAVALGLGAVVLASNEGSGERQFILSGVLAALAVVVREELLLFAVVLGGLVWLPAPRAWRRALAWGAAFALVMGSYQVAVYAQAGAQIQSGAYQRVEPGVRQASYLIANGIGSLPNFIFDPDYRAWVWPLALAVIAYAVIGRWRARAALFAQSLLLLFIIIGVWLGILDLNPTQGMHGVLGASPLLVLMWVPGVLRARETRKLGILLLGFLALSVAGLGLLTTLGPLQAGLEWGTRFGLILFALGAPLAAKGLALLWQRARESCWGQFHFIAALAVVAVSLAVQMRGLWLMRTNMDSGAFNQTLLLAYPEAQIITDVVWLAGELPGVYIQKELYWFESPAELRQWLSAAHAQGVTTFAGAFVTPLTIDNWAAAAPPGTSVVKLESRVTAGMLTVGRYEIVVGER
jgi:hypothetical protein